MQRGTGHILTAKAYSPSLATSLLVVAMLLVTTGSRVAQLGYAIGGLLLFVAAAACLVYLLGRHPSGLRRPVTEPSGRLGPDHVILLALMLHLGLQAGYVIGRAGSDPVGVTAMVAFVAFGLLTVDGVRRQPRLASWSAVGTAVAFLMFGLAWIAVVRTATIDVLVWQEVGLDRLLDGVDPYVRGYPNIYSAEAAARFYAPELVDGDVVSLGYPYPPLSLGLALPGWLLGDVRISHVLALTVAGLLLSTWGGYMGRVGAILLWTNPITPLVIENGWTETFVVLALVLVVASWNTRGRRLGVCLGLLLAVKQYALLLALPLWWGTRRLGREQRGVILRWAAFTGAVVTVPMALWHVSEFWFSVVELQFHQPYREDAVSLLVASYELLSWPPPGSFTLVLVTGVAASGLWAWRHATTRPLGVQLAAGSLLTMVFFLLAKQAFLNYYFLSASTLAIAVACTTDCYHEGAPPVDA